MYALDQLAQRYHIDPRDLDTDDDSVWLQRSLEFMRLEASVTVSKSKPKVKRG